MSLSFRTSFLLVTALMVSASFAADSNIDIGKSTMVAVFKQENVPVEASLKRFSGRITYDPTRVGASTAFIQVETGSLDIGDEAYNAEVRKKAWFDSMTYPVATFQSTAIKAGLNGTFEASGNLQLKGNTSLVVVPVKAETLDGTTTFTGTIPVSRKAFGIGDAAWDDVLDDKVIVRFKFTVGSTR